MNADVMLSIVIVSYNGRDLLRQTLESVSRVAGALIYECIVVDNDSQDGSVDMVHADFPQVILLANPENVGFARAANRGIEQSRGKYILLLNPDTVLTDNLLDGLVDFMEKHPHAGAASPAVLWPDGNFQLGVGGFAASLRSFAGHFLFLHCLSGGRFPAFFIQQRFYQRRAVQLDWLSGVCLIARRQVFDQVGGFCPLFFMYAEDVEWCDRVRRAGWELYYCPQFAIYHYLGGSSKAHSNDVPQSTLWLDALDRYLRARFSLRKTASLEVIAAGGLAMRFVGYAASCLWRGKDQWSKARQMFRFSQVLCRSMIGNLWAAIFHRREEQWRIASPGE